MNETTLTDACPHWVEHLISTAIRQLTAHADWCDHCNHGDHLPCDLWGRQGCRCPHHDEEDTPNE